MGADYLPISAITQDQDHEPHAFNIAPILDAHA